MRLLGDHNLSPETVRLIYTVSRGCFFLINITLVLLCRCFMKAESSPVKSRTVLLSIRTCNGESDTEVGTNKTRDSLWTVCPYNQPVQCTACVYVWVYTYCIYYRISQTKTEVTLSYYFLCSVSTHLNTRVSLQHRIGHVTNSSSAADMCCHEILNHSAQAACHKLQLQDVACSVKPSVEKNKCHTDF